VIGDPETNKRERMLRWIGRRALKAEKLGVTTRDLAGLELEGAKAADAIVALAEAQAGLPELRDRERARLACWLRCRLARRERCSYASSFWTGRRSLHVEAVLEGISSDATRICEGVFADDENGGP
jgi:hypothetical protein